MNCYRRFGVASRKFQFDMLINQTDKLASVRETMVSALSGLRNEADIQSFKAQLENDLGEMLDTANTRDSFGNFIFSGAAQNRPAFDEATLTYQGSFGAGGGTVADRRPVEIARGQKIDVNVSGRDAFAVEDPSGEYENVLQVVRGIIDKIDTFPPGELSVQLGKELQLLDSAQDKVIAVRAQIGDRQERMERATNSNADRLVDVQLSRQEAVGVDLAEAISQYQFTQTQLNASQQSFVTAFRQTLFDKIG